MIPVLARNQSVPVDQDFDFVAIMIPNGLAGFGEQLPVMIIVRVAMVDIIQPRTVAHKQFEF